MGRSPSPRRRDDYVRNREDFGRGREWERDRERNRDRRRQRSRERVRSRSRERPDNERRRRSRSAERQRRRRSRSDSSERNSTGKPQKSQIYQRPAITAADLEGKTPEEQEMIKMMGFGGFDTTKGRKVENNDVGEVQVVLKRKYRQYMNRKGGFNRPLDFVA